MSCWGCLSHRRLCKEEQGVWIREPRYDLAFMASMLLEVNALDDAIAYLTDFESQFHQGRRYATVLSQLATRLAKADRLAEAHPYFHPRAWRSSRTTRLGGMTSARSNSSKVMRRVRLRTFAERPEEAPEDAAIQRNLATVLIVKRRPGGCGTRLDGDAAPARTKHVEVRLMLADALRQSGQIPAALRDLSRGAEGTTGSTCRRCGT